MMHIDTLEFYKDLVNAGITESAAEVIVKGVEESRKVDLSHLATKQDLEIEVTKLRSDIKIVHWMGATILTIISAIAIKIFLN